jgi:hypothetical protein
MLTWLWLACRDEPVPHVTREPELTWAEFQEQFRQRYCEQMYVCDPDVPCEVADTGLADCETFDAEAARACLEGAWTCNESFPGFPYPEEPDSCDVVCPNP